MEVELVQSEVEIRENLYRFDRDAADNPELAIDLLRQTTYWVANSTGDAFGPSKFVGLKDMTFARYESARVQSRMRPISHFDGGQTRKAIATALGEQYAASPFFRQRLLNWCTQRLGNSAKPKNETLFVRLPSEPEESLDTALSSGNVFTKSPPLETHMSVDDELSIDLEPEDDTPLNIAPEERRVRTNKSDTPVETLRTWLLRGKLNPQPDFQRNYVWNNVRASRLIESLLLDIPIPVVYVVEEPDRTYSVVDGQQRVTSIRSYLDGRFPDGREFRLNGLQVLTELNRKRFAELSRDHQEAILESQIRLIIIEQGSNPDVKFEVFERLNLGAVKLNDQELRNCVYRGKYNELLRELATYPSMLNVMGHSTPHDRMADSQLILRFFAMWRSTHLKYKSPMKRFLNREMEDHRNPTDPQLREMRELFTRSIDAAWQIFGEHAFRRFHSGDEKSRDGEWERKLNVALWDTVLYSFSFFQKTELIGCADAIREELLDLLSHDAMFNEYLASTTDKPERVQHRAEVWQRRLKDLLQPQGPRSFTLELKNKLFCANATCRLCGNRIHTLDDAEVDHIQHYWRGGKTVPENARLAHRFCNRSRRHGTEA